MCIILRDEMSRFAEGIDARRNPPPAASSQFNGITAAPAQDNRVAVAAVTPSSRQQTLGMA